MSAYKKFEQDEFDTYDNLARNIMKEFFSRQGYTVTDNSDKYGVDLVVDDRLYCEVQVKNAWSGKTFPFSDVNIESRKKKYFFLDKPTVFCLLNREHTHALFLSAKDVSNSERKEVRNKKIPEGELFYKVPIQKAKIVRIR